MASDMRAVLGFVQHLGIPSERLLNHPIEVPSEKILSADASSTAI